ncbi:hypothetical protein NMY22_g12007 [Coprinellus aureogranulatus]|nr:hypothetical protein NMY22_g12007 [Coprinellus aureogranulatus]
MSPTTRSQTSRTHSSPTFIKKPAVDLVKRPAHYHPQDPIGMGWRVVYVPPVGYARCIRTLRIADIPQFRPFPQVAKRSRPMSTLPTKGAGPVRLKRDKHGWYTVPIRPRSSAVHERRNDESSRGTASNTESEISERQESSVFGQE